ncbi:MAG TPA: endo-1,4-beta-xylanase [Candidatus Saccharimonadales bacterium]|nr:endo-1,4-beta-xylanase [Candidatus Saccharimonadales bacterium]
MKNYLNPALVAMLLAIGLLPARAEDQPALKDVFKKDFLIGAALNPSQFDSQSNDNCEVAIIKKNFNSITPENVLKWESVHPAPDRYNFGPSDRYVEFGVKNGMFIIGHNLIWHSQTPGWVFADAQGKPLDRDALLQRMRDHISTVVGRYKGKIRGWDVVNEALNEDGTRRPSQWMNIIGGDYLVKAYQFAHEADPAAQLYYNEYSLENPSKRAGAAALIRDLQSNGVPITAVGLQGHYKMNWPSPQEVDATIETFANMGLKVMITELDIDLLPAASGSRGADVGMNFKLRAEENPYTNGLPAPMEEALARRYAELFKTFVKHRDQITRVTFWGVTDRDSWLNDWPVRGRTSYPLLFGRDCAPKPAFEAVIAVARQP